MHTCDDSCMCFAIETHTCPYCEAVRAKVDPLITDERNVSRETFRAAPMFGIPPEVACPFCGGYVRGHQYIGQTYCSVNQVDPAL